MKVRAINIIEVILFAVFSVFFFLTKTKVYNLGWHALILASALAILYCPFGFYTLKTPGIKVIYSSLFGFLFNIALLGISLGALEFGLSALLIMVMLVIYIMAVSLPAIANYLYKYQDAMIIMYDKKYTVRYLLLFCYMIYALVTFNFQFS